MASLVIVALLQVPLGGYVGAQVKVEGDDVTIRVRYFTGRVDSRTSWCE